MSDKQIIESDPTRETKRAQFAETEKSKSKAKPILIAALLAAVAIAGYILMGASRDTPTVVAVQDQPNKPSSTSEVRVSLAEVSVGKAKFFDYKLANGQQVRFFVLKSSEGDYRAALDACEVCAHAKKGYHQEGDDMVCNNCDKRFATALIGKISGGCHPVALNAKTEGNSLVIKKAELDAGGRYF